MENCDRCGGETKWKRITSKKDKKEYDLLECMAGCRSGRFAYSFFPKEEARTKQPLAQAVDKIMSGVPSEIALLNINQKLDIIISLLKPNNETETVPF